MQPSPSPQQQPSPSPQQQQQQQQQQPSPPFTELRAQVHAFMSSHWVFGELCKPLTIPREAIDPATGDVNHYYGEVRELRASGASTGRASTIWFKKKDRGFDLRLGPAVIRRPLLAGARSMPAMRDIFVGEVERGGFGRAKYIAWHCNAGPVFVLASFVAPGRAPVAPDKLREALQQPTPDQQQQQQQQQSGRDDLWLIARLALYPGGVEEVVAQELTPSDQRTMRVTDDSPLRFAYQLAFHFQDAQLQSALAAAAQAAGIVSAPPRTKRARAPEDAASYSSHWSNNSHHHGNTTTATTIVYSHVTGAPSDAAAAAADASRTLRPQTCHSSPCAAVLVRSNSQTANLAAAAAAQEPSWTVFALEMCV